MGHHCLVVGCPPFSCGHHPSVEIRGGVAVRASQEFLGDYKNQFPLLPQESIRGSLPPRPLAALAGVEGGIFPRDVLAADFAFRACCFVLAMSKKRKVEEGAVKVSCECKDGCTLVHPKVKIRHQRAGIHPLLLLPIVKLFIPFLCPH